MLPKSHGSRCKYGEFFSVQPRYMTPIQYNKSQRCFSFLVANAATRVDKEPMNRQMEMALGPSVSCFSEAGACPASSGLFPGSKMAKTMALMKVPMNCGSVV